MSEVVDQFISSATIRLQHFTRAETRTAVKLLRPMGSRRGRVSEMLFPKVSSSLGLNRLVSEAVSRASRQVTQVE